MSLKWLRKTAPSGILFIVVLVVMPGCQLRPSLSDNAIYVRGIVRQVNDDFQFRPCGRDGWYPLSHLSASVTQRYNRLIGHNSGAPLYIEGWHELGSGASFDQLMVIGGDLQACEADLSRVELRASGSDPGWMLDLDDQRLVLHLYHRNETWNFRLPNQVEIQGNDWIWRSSVTTRGRKRSFQLTISKAQCVDNYDVWFGLKSKVEFDNRTYHGCARYGDLGLLKLAGDYHTTADMLTSAHLKLQPNRSASWQINHHNGQPSITRNAHWRLLDNNRLLLSIDADRQGRGDTVLLWQLDEQGNLVLLSDSERYGKGLKLVRSSGGLQWAKSRRDHLP